GLGRLTQKQELKQLSGPVYSTWTYAYDTTTHKTTTVDPIGNADATQKAAHTTVDTYDNLGRLETETIPDPNDPVHFNESAWGYSYDLAGNLTDKSLSGNKMNAAGQVTHDQWLAQTEYTYDAMNHVSTEEDFLTPDSLFFPGYGMKSQNTYDAAGNRITST